MQYCQEAILLEVDVTNARRIVRLANRGAECTVSFLAWLVGTIARTLENHPEARAGGSRQRRRGTSDVSVSVLVDRDIGSHRVPFPVVITRADRTPVSDIQNALHRARTTPADEAGFVLGHESRFLTALYSLIPVFVRRSLVQSAARNRRRLNRFGGDVLVSSPGMGGRVRGWFIPSHRHPICLGVGAVTSKAQVMNGRIEAREVLHMTVLVDNSIVAARPVAGWISELVRTLENARDLVIG